MQIGSLIDLVAADLNDRAHIVWTRDQLRAYIQEGVNNAFVERPELFLEEVIVKVEACKPYQQVCECQNIRRVLGQSDANGRIIKELRERTNKDKLQWPGRTCTVNPDDFELTSYSVDESTNKIKVYPPVPIGQDVYVVVECSVMPDGLAEGDSIDSNIGTAAHQWALYCARMVDAENNPAVFSAAQIHKQAFWQILLSQRIGLDVDNDAGRTVNTQNANR